MKDIEDEIPFAVPEGWAWCRLPEVCRKPITDGTHNSPPNSASGDFLYITAKNIKNLAICLDDATYVSKEIHESIYSRCSPELNDVLLTKDGTIGEVAVNNLNYPFSMLSSVALIKPSNGILPWFLAYILISDLLQNKMKKNAKGSALKRIILAQINNFIIPLPPLAEQKRIVTAIEAIFTQIDLMEQNKVDLQTAVKQAKSKILDLAIHGKLVPQDPADEPASVMLERLRAEKEAKIVAGEMKRGKNDSYIYRNPTDNCYYQKYTDGCEENISDEIPFDVPAGWVWCRLAEISKFISRGKTPVYTKESQYPVLAQKCNQWDGIRLDKVLFLDPNSLSKWTNEYHLQHEDIVINSTGTGTIGRVGIFDIGILGKYPFIVPDSHISIVRCYKAYIYQKYIYTIFTSKYLQNKINKAATGSTNQKELPKNILMEFFLPVPPLAEQKRIVAKIEELFAKLDFITTTLAE